MTGTVRSPYTAEQTAAWLRGLLAIAWADGDFDEKEQQAIAALTYEDESFQKDWATLEPISPAELATALGDDPVIADNFLRTAVMVALADGVYTSVEDEALHQFCTALDRQIEGLEALRQTLEDVACVEDKTKAEVEGVSTFKPDSQKDVLAPMRAWLDNLEMHDPKVARFLCKMIPPQCPFERDIKLFGRKIVHIPPMCKLNPLYEQLVGLRFRALSYLADDCGEDVTPYI
ncbi:MAG TPA: nitrogenase [Oscillatoriales cyanobacterium M59_W2019_021]|nr:MAG: nitrogenase [Cyanobacteria bacterium J055]HIK30156.1 nitrogenase [Oscillatoriales cyanobacterium M4454_W2019_049]HIK52160.1 nitrogenase [Oscillatoriales cyanobacterium M59_W2019_021]